MLMKNKYNFEIHKKIMWIINNAHIQNKLINI